MSPKLIIPITMKENILKFLFVLMCCSSSLWAQEKTVTGVVTDESKTPLPGVNVVIKGTTRGVSTDFDGKYTLHAKANETIEFSSVGYITQTKKVSGGG